MAKNTTTIDIDKAVSDLIGMSKDNPATEEMTEQHARAIVMRWVTPVDPPAIRPLVQPRGNPRIRLEATRSSKTHKIVHGSYEGYVTVGFYENAQPGEVFIKISKEGSIMQALIDMIAMQFSYLLQHGVPAAWILQKWEHHRFEPLDEKGNSILDTFAQAVQHCVSEHGGILELDYNGQEVTS